MSTTEKKENKIPVYDLHCDLLLYLESEKRTPNDPEVRCSIPQLQAGGVKMQTLAIYTKTGPETHQKASLQLERYKTLPKSLNFRVSIENASGFLEENEDFDLIRERFARFQKETGGLLYISMTWNDENRFGGGNLTTVGLKPDGEKLLELLDGTHVAIDFSHTSDRLAYDILNHIDKKNLKVVPMASHSNFRKVTDVPRNLPDDIALEIIKREGVIGLNLVRKFVGDPFEEKFVEMVKHGISLGAEDSLSLGADFFYIGDVPSMKDPMLMFMDHYSNSSCYPRLLSLLERNFKSDIVQKIAHRNCEKYMQRVGV